MPKFQLTLFIAGKNAHAERIVSGVHRMMVNAAAEYELTVCDILEEPQIAEKEKVMATPTLVLSSPPPCRRVVGDVSDPARVLSYLGIPSGGSRSEPGRHGTGKPP
ncbi:circadian clock KaiB family protein [Geotalea uraniireducens]|nr:circadian clock KaiB family protein [Geotalea uraniireducens]